MHVPRYVPENVFSSVGQYSLPCTTRAEKPRKNSKALHDSLSLAVVLCTATRWRPSVNRERGSASTVKKVSEARRHG